jgi:hypothetical protein
VGAWGELAFDNDAANDWAYGLDDVNDLSLVESAFAELEAVGSAYLDQDLACNALAACEVLARLRGQPGYTICLHREGRQMGRGSPGGGAGSVSQSGPSINLTAFSGRAPSCVTCGKRQIPDPGMLQSPTCAAA